MAVVDVAVVVVVAVTVAAAVKVVAAVVAVVAKAADIAAAGVDMVARAAMVLFFILIWVPGVVIFTELYLMVGILFNGSYSTFGRRPIAHPQFSVIRTCLFISRLSGLMLAFDEEKEQPLYVILTFHITPPFLVNAVF